MKTRTYPHGNRRFGRLVLVIASALALTGLGLGTANAVPSGPSAARAVSFPAKLPPPPCHTPPGTTQPVCSTQAAQDQVNTLEATLAYWQANMSTFARSHPGPLDIADYDVAPLWQEGIDGSGTTVAVIEGWDDANIGSVMTAFDTRYDLPAADVTTIYPDGPLPATCPAGMVALGSYGSCSAWAGELTLDVETVHMIAPYAKIIISATPADSEIADDQADQVAPPEMMKALEVIGGQHLANVISISDGTGETTYTYGDSELKAQNAGELAAAADGVPVLVATGDCGVVQNLAVASSQCGDTSTTPDTAAWDDSPWITAVGGSVPQVSSTGTITGPDVLWPSSGAGYSSVYPRPGFQDAVDRDTGATMRSVPDITMDSHDGTSEAAPGFAGILALATQLKGGQDIGPVNPALYQIGPRGAAAGIVDITSGNNSIKLRSTGTTVAGFSAGPGFDVASGWGTIDAAKFAPALDLAADQDSGLARAEAAAQLRAMEHIQLTPSAIATGGDAYLLAGNFLPMHPVQLSVDGQPVTTLTANELGEVTDMLDPAALGLSAGHHTVTLTSMLLTETGSFYSS
ncbi:MAG TPA: S8 family serine peptidase [Trebonia sp.]|nr:S8 family serine peptidase [Trebonia sp.]